MKLFLIFILTSCSTIAFAQSSEEPALFPELSGFGSERPKETAENVPVKEKVEEKGDEEDGESSESQVEEEKQEEDLFKENADTPVPSEDKEKEEKPEEEIAEDEKERYINIIIDDVKATLTPNRNASFCTATFAVINTLKKEVKAFSGSFTVGKLTKNFSFNNIGKEQAVAGKYMFVGTSCEEILNPPAYTIEKCQIEGWSEKKCKSKVRFVPLPKQANFEE